MKKVFAGVLTLLLACAVHAAGYYHRADALEQLRLAFDRNDPQEKAAYFRGYVVGVADSENGKAWCPPDNVGADRVQQIVSKYMRDNAGVATQDAVSVVTAALGASFPCAGR